MARAVVYTLAIHLRGGHTLHTNALDTLVPDDDLPADAIYGSLHQHMIEEFATCVADGKYVDLMTCGDEPGYVAVNPTEVQYFQTIIREIKPVVLPTPPAEPAEPAEPADLITGVDLGTLIRPAHHQL